jgi:hypothetical protein
VGLYLKFPTEHLRQKIKSPLRLARNIDKKLFSLEPFSNAKLRRHEQSSPALARRNNIGAGFYQL